jgi:hypothetical protein
MLSVSCAFFVRHQQMMQFSTEIGIYVTNSFICLFENEPTPVSNCSKIVTELADGANLNFNFSPSAHLYRWRIVRNGTIMYG